MQDRSTRNSRAVVSRTIWARGPKRVCDLLLGLLGVVLLSPILLAATLLIRLSSPGPVFFMQVRTGRDGREFQPYKFRTMREGRVPDPDELVPLDHPEITAAGRILRRLKIDELPQILNVVKGDMSLIGPRPTLPQQTREYDDFKKQRLLVRPGVTGLAQVNGNATISWDERIRYDVHYVRHHGFWMDVISRHIGLRPAVGLDVGVLRGEQRFARPFEQSPYGCGEQAQ